MGCIPSKNGVSDTESEHTPDNWPQMEITLIDFLAGHVLRTALFQFEDVMGPWVKITMQQHIPDDPTVVAAAAAFEEQRCDLATLKTELSSRREALQAQLRLAESKDREELHRQKTAVEKDWREAKEQLDSLSSVTPPSPAWIEECRKCVGRTTKRFVAANTRWDTHLIVSVMRAHLRDIFSQYLEDHFHAKELLGGIIRVSAARTRRAHRKTLVEADVLDALLATQTVLEQCQFSDAAQIVSQLLGDAKDWVEQARSVREGTIIRGPALSVAEVTAQTAYYAISSWEKWVETVVGQELIYKDGTITFGQDLDPRWANVIKGLHSDLKPVATQRHWYFHHIPDNPDLNQTFYRMQRIVSFLHASCTVNSERIDPWIPPPVPTGPAQAHLRMSVPAVRITPPIPRFAGIVGRDIEIAQAVKLLLKRKARVLIHGLPGMGKDVIMAEVAHHLSIQELGGFQMWLQASSEPIFRRQLIQHFSTHRPSVVKGLKDNANKAVAAIKRWLSNNTSWVMFVEDASLTSETLWTILPRNGSGRVVVTSQAQLQTQYPFFKGSAIQLDTLNTIDSIELLRQFDAFASTSEFREYESEDALFTRCEARGHGHCYIPPPPNISESSKERRARWLRMTRLLQESELSRPELSTFLEKVVGNLPLTVALCGNMVRANPCIRTVGDLIQLFETQNIEALDTAGHDRRHDRHYYGLLLSTKINLDRLQSDGTLPECDRKAAVTLLAALSMLDRALTPESFFEDQQNSDTHESDIFTDSSALHRAQKVCIRYGFFRPSLISIGIMHQQVQRCLRSALLMSGNTRLAVTAPETVPTSIAERVTSCFEFSDNTPTSMWSDCRQLAPCVEAWCNLFQDPDMHNRLATVKKFQTICISMLNQVSNFHLTANGDAPAALPLSKQAVHHCHSWNLANDSDLHRSMNTLAIVYAELGRHQDALELRIEVMDRSKKDLSHDHPSIATAMNNLALTYSHLGRLQDALELKTEVLAFRKRTLPHNDPRIANAMNNMALTYSDLGKHQDALELKTEVLEFRTQVLPPDHPDIAKAKHNLASTYSDLGRHQDALELNTEVLEFYKRVLAPDSPDHPHIAMSMSSLASTYSLLGRHQEALDLKTEVLALRERVLPPDHPKIFSSMSNLALTYSHLKRHQDALDLKTKVLAYRERVLPADHPKTFDAMSNLALTYSDLGRHQDALELKTKVLAFRERVLPPDHPKTADAMKNLASTYSDLGRHHDALDMKTKVLALRQRVSNSGNPKIVDAGINAILAST